VTALLVKISLSFDDILLSANAAEIRSLRLFDYSIGVVILN